MRYDWSGLGFEWDDGKADRNLTDHKAFFTEAATVFGDPTAKYSRDPDHSDDEERYIIVGYSDDDALMFISYTTRREGEDERIRIISARYATVKERKRHERYTRES